jgi:hypothetical protein
MIDRIKIILREFENGDDDKDYTKDDIFPPKVYEKYFNFLDKDPENMFKRLEVLQLAENFDGDYNQYEKEYNIALKYLTEYENRTPFYITFEFDGNTLSEFFTDDRDYDIQKMVKDYFNGDYDYNYDYDCMDVDSWLIDKIDEKNMETLKEKYYQENLDDEGSEEDFYEFIKSEYGSEIGCSASEAQNSADVEYLHSDFENSVMDYLSRFNGKLEEDEKGGIKFVGNLEIGELANSEWFQDVLEDALYSYYPDLIDIFAGIKEKEQSGWGGQYNYFFPDDLIRINTDKHFRYGGAGDLNWTYFNEILSDRLNY